MNPLLAAFLLAIAGAFAKFVEEWLKSRLTAAQGMVPSRDRFPSEQAHAEAVVDEAIRGTPRLAFARRGILRFMKRNLGNVQAADMDELRDIARSAEEE